MLVNLEPYGRLGNRLFLGAHLIAFSLKHSLPILNLGFGEFVDLFPWFQGNGAFAYPWRPTGTPLDAKRLLLRYRLVDRLPWSHRFRYWGEEDWDFDSRDVSELTAPLSQGKSVFFHSWLFRGPQSVVRFRRQILEVFRPSEALIQEVDAQISLWRHGEPLLVGVHVRWEDFRGTPHYIDQQGFLDAMNRARSLWPERSVRFVLFSNEKLPEDGWGGLDFVVSPAPSVLFDLTAMTQCDFLMGPPSTFSGWASFSGTVPLLRMTAEPRPVTLEQFQVVAG